MLEKVNNLNKNVVILMAIVIIAITAIAITLIATNEDSTRGSADSLEEFQEYFTSEYGVKPVILIETEVNSEAHAKDITNQLRKDLGLEESFDLEAAGKKLIITKSEDETIELQAVYE